MMFIPYVCCGDPDLGFTSELVKALAPYSYAIELGIPFSDPIADGKTIQGASNRALKNGMNIEKAFLLAGQLRRDGVETPFAFMTYYNIVYAHGCRRFLERMKQTGVQGMIIPDLPFGEDPVFEKLAKEGGISIIGLIAPNTPEERAKRILESRGMFTYLVSVAGTTGARESVGKESLEFVKRTRELAGGDKKLCVGFGVSSAAQALQFARAGADGVIVGSEIINVYSRHLREGGSIGGKALEEVEALAREISQA